MTLPGDPANDRRAVPRHLRDSEHEMTAATGTFGARAEDARSGHGRFWLYAFIALLAAGVGLWYVFGAS